MIIYLIDIIIMLVHLLILMASINTYTITQEPISFIVQSYNQQRFEQIYAKFTFQIKQAMTEQVFSNAMKALKGRLGNIEDSMLLTVGQIFAVCQNNLDTGLILYQTNVLGEFSSFTFNFAAESTFSYFARNQNNSHIALSYSTGKDITFDYNQNAMLAICSVYKILIAVQYARQTASGKIKGSTCVPLDELNLYYLPHVDAEHGKWLSTLTANCVTYQEIVLAMLRYSSNNNAQFLTDLLGPSAIDSLISTLQIRHSPTLQLASSMLAMSNFDNLPREAYINSLKSLTQSELRMKSFQIHDKLKQKTFKIDDAFYLDPEIIDIHVQLLEKSTSSDYHQIMQLINNGQYFESNTQLIIDTIFDNITKSGDFGKLNYIHAGAKGGSANYPGMHKAALAVSGYATLKNGSRSSYSLIYNGLQSTEFGVLYQDMNYFIIALQVSGYYSTEFIRRLNLNI